LRIWNSVLLGRFSRKPRRDFTCDDIRTSFHPDGLALLHIPTGRVFVCNRTGARIWQGVSMGLNMDSIAEEISREYGVARDMVRQHTCSFLSELQGQGFIQAERSLE
jgi:hypothetical protein